MVNEEKTAGSQVQLDQQGSPAQDGVHNIRLLQTVFLVLLWVATGLYSTLISVALPDLRDRLQADTDHISFAMAFKLVGCLVGSVVGGYLIDCYRRLAHLFIATPLMVCGMANMLHPWSGNAIVLGVLFAVEGLFSAIYSTVSQAYIVAMWGRQTGPALHAMMSGYTVGMLLTPLLAYPFLAPDSTESVNISDPGLNATNAPERTTPQRHPNGESRVEIPYFIIDSTAILLSVAFWVFLYKGYAEKFKWHGEEKSKWRQILSPGSWANGDSMFGVTIVVLLVLYAGMACTAGLSLNALGFTFLRDTPHLDFTLEEAMLWSLTYALVQLLGRCFATALSNYCRIHIMLAVEVLGNAAGAILLATLGTNNKIIFWICSFVVGTASALLTPAIFTWLNNYVVLYGIIVGLSDMGINIFGFAAMWLNGYLYTSVDEVGFLYVAMTASLITVVLAATMQILASRHGTRADRQITHSTKL